MYSYSLDGETFYEAFPTIEEAVIEGFDIGGDEQEVVHVGENAKPKKVSEYLRTYMVERLIETIQEEAFEENGEATEGFLEFIDLNCDKDVISELMEKMKTAIDVWANDYTLQPDFCQIINVKSYTREDLNNLQVSGA